MDKNVIALIKQRDEAAFEELYAEYKNLVYYVIYQIVRNNDIASALLQDTFLTVYNKIDQYAGGNFKYWLLTIAKNLSKTYLSRDMVKEKRYIKDNDYIYETIESKDNSLGKYDEILNANFLPEEKDIIVYHIVFGYKFKEIAKMMEKTPKYISGKYKASIKTLKAIMEEIWNESENQKI